MQTANIMLALGGDAGNMVPKSGVTAAEIAVLRVIHGDDSVTEIEPVGEAKNEDGSKRTDRQERQRLLEKYGRQQEGRFTSPAVDALFPGAAARVFHDLDELDLPEELYKAEKRVTAKSKPAKAVEKPADEGDADDPLDGMTKDELVKYAEANDIEIDAKAKKADILDQIRAAQVPQGDGSDDGDEDDGIGEMQDANLFK